MGRRPMLAEAGHKLKLEEVVHIASVVEAVGCEKQKVEEEGRLIPEVEVAELQPFLRRHRWFSLCLR